MKLEIYKLSSDWCGNCKVLSNNLKERKDQYTEVDVEKDMELAVKYSVKNLPTCLFFLGGELKEKKVGVFTEEEFDEIVQRVIES